MLKKRAAAAARTEYPAQEDRQEESQGTAEYEEAVVEEVFQLNELVPIRSSIQDDMKRIADMEEEFSHIMDPVLRMYNAAMNVTATRMSIIKDEFKYRGKRCPIRPYRHAAQVGKEHPGQAGEKSIWSCR